MTDDPAHAGQPAADQTTASRKYARSWLWMFLLLSLWAYGMRTGAAFLIVLSGLEAVFLPVSIFLYPVQILGAALVPALLGRLHFLDNPRAEKRLTVALLSLCLAILAGFVWIPGTALRLISFYLMILCPSVALGVALRRGALCWREEKVALYIGMAYVMHVVCAQLEYYAFFATGNVVFYIVSSYCFYAGLLLAAIVLRLRLPNTSEPALPKSRHIYSKRFASVMAVLLVVHAFFNTAINTVIYFENMDDFHTPAYELFFYALALLVLLAAIFLYHRRTFLGPAIACLLLLCFGQGLSLFGIESMPLAITYNLTTMIGKMPPFVLALALPVYYAVGERKRGLACLGFVISSGADFLLLLTQLTEKGIGGVLPVNSRQGVLLLVGLCLIGEIFYLYTRFERTRTDTLRRMIEESRRERRSTQDTVDGLDLTAREKEVTALLLAGDSQKIIAVKLGISIPTVSFHTKNVYRKLHIQSKAELFSLFLATEATGVA